MSPKTTPKTLASAAGAHAWAWRVWFTVPVLAIAGMTDASLSRDCSQELYFFQQQPLNRPFPMA